MEKLQTFDSLVSKNDFVIKFANVNGSLVQRVLTKCLLKQFSEWVFL